MILKINSPCKVVAFMIQAEHVSTLQLIKQWDQGRKIQPELAVDRFSFDTVYETGLFAK